MIITAQTTVTQSETVDTAALYADFGQNTWENLRSAKLNTQIEPLTWTDNILKIRRGAIVQVLSCGINSPAGIVSGDLPAQMSLRFLANGETIGEPLYDSIIPFIPTEFQIGYTIRIPENLAAEFVYMQMAYFGRLTVFGLPDLYNGATIPVRGFAKFNVDKRMVV